MAVSLSEAIRNQHLDNIRDAIDDDTDPGVIEIYDGSRPSTGGEAVSTQTLLGTCTFSMPSAPNASGGVLTFDSIEEDSAADESGTASWARVNDGAGNWVMDMDVGESGSGASLILNTVEIVEGGPIRIDSGVLTAGNE